MESINRHITNHRVHNRIRAIMAHTTRYAFKGEARLAADSGVSKSALNRLVNGQSSPSFALVCALTRALEKHLGKSLDPRELISFDGTYLTPSVCELAGCKGCLPTEAYDEHNILKAEYRGIRPGHWSAGTPSPPALTGPINVERESANRKDTSAEAGEKVKEVL